MKKKWLIGSAATALLLLAGCTSNSTVATSSAGNVTKDELYEAMKKSSAGQQSLYTLLVQKVAVANVKGKEAVQKATDEFMSSRQESAGGKDAFEKLVKNYGYDSIDDFKKAVYNNQAILQVIKENIDISDDDIAKAYETYEPSVTASHILVADEATAQDIINQLNNGGDWNALAAQYSTDTANKDNGGSLGTFKPSTMVSEFAAALKGMKDGEISQTPVKTSYGYHVIKMEHNPTKGTLDEERENVKNDLLTTKSQDSTTQQEVMNKLLQAANIKIEDSYLSQALSSILNPTSSSSSSSTTSSSSSSSSQSDESSTSSSSSSSAETSSSSSETTTTKAN